MKWIKDRFPVLIIFATLIAGLFTLAWQYQTSQNYQNPKNSNPIIQSETPFFHQGVHALPPGEDNADQQDKEKRDLEIADHEAQIWMARYALIGVILGIFGSYLLLRTLLYTRAASSAASDTLLIAEKTLEVSKDVSYKQLRAYLSAEIAIEPPDEYGFPEFKILIKNFGQTPAYNIRAHWAVGRRENVEPNKIRSVPTMNPTETFEETVCWQIHLNEVMKMGPLFIVLIIKFTDHTEIERHITYVYNKQGKSFPRWHYSGGGEGIEFLHGSRKASLISMKNSDLKIGREQ